MRHEDVVEVAPDVLWCRGRLVSWYLLRDGDDLTLVDAGYPGDVGDVMASLSLVGAAGADVGAVLITHAHADHLGAVAALQAAHGTPAHVGPGDVGPARSGELEQVSPASLVRAAWRPGVLSWSVRAVRRGGLRQGPLPGTRPYPGPPGAALDLPGGPVPVPTPGHTPGHTALFLPQHGVVLSGDALVTGHPTSRRRGPQLLPEMFNGDTAGARSALGVLAGLDADLLLPGHGDPVSGPVARAVDQALA